METVFQTEVWATVGVNHWEHDSARATGVPDPGGGLVVEQDGEVSFEYLYSGSLNLQIG